VIRGNRRLIVQEVADEVSTSIGPCTEKLQMCCVSASHVTPHLQLSGKTSDIYCAPSILFSRLRPSRVFLFPRLKTTLKGRCFQTTEEIQENMIRELRTITESAFREALQQWTKCWKWRIASRGDYFEGDSAYNAVK
jgi:hypothetical protein